MIPLLNYSVCLKIQVKKNILGVGVRKITLPVAAGRNLAVLVEAAVRNYILKLRGIDCTKEFIERQSSFIKMKNK